MFGCRKARRIEYTKNPGFAVAAQLAGRARSYEDRQRYPADYDAQVGQRLIARHALEHLATTDRGVIQMRKMMREGIRSVARGGGPEGAEYQRRRPGLDIWK